MRTSAAFLVLFLFAQGLVSAQTQQARYDKEELKKDYRAFLQQLKALNAEYKQITGEIGQVMKEEGVPAWDMGEGLGTAGGQSVKELGDGAYLKETEKEMVLTLDLPGYKKDSIQLSFKDGKTLVVVAKRKLEAVTRSFERSFDLPMPGDQKNTTAGYEDGVLTVQIPKGTSQEVAIPVR